MKSNGCIGVFCVALVTACSFARGGPPAATRPAERNGWVHRVLSAMPRDLIIRAADPDGESARKSAAAFKWFQKNVVNTPGSVVARLDVVSPNPEKRGESLAIFDILETARGGAKYNVGASVFMPASDAAGLRQDQLYRIEGTVDRGAMDKAPGVEFNVGFRISRAKIEPEPER